MGLRILHSILKINKLLTISLEFAKIGYAICLVYAFEFTIQITGILKILLSFKISILFWLSGIKIKSGKVCKVSKLLVNVPPRHHPALKDMFVLFALFFKSCA